MSKHTPGPWKSALAVVAHAPSVFVITNGKWGAPNIATTYSEVDAALIAAAPELLRSAERALTALEPFEEEGHAWATLACDSLRTAITKAEGRGE